MSHSQRNSVSFTKPLNHKTCATKGLGKALIFPNAQIRWVRVPPTVLFILVTAEEASIIMLGGILDAVIFDNGTTAPHATTDANTIIYFGVKTKGISH